MEQNQGRAFTLRSRVQQRLTDELTSGLVLSRGSAERKESRQMGVDGHLRTPRERHVDCGAGVCVGAFDVASDCGLTQTGDDLCGIKKERKYSQKLQRVGIFAFVKLSEKKDLISPPAPRFLNTWCGNRVNLLNSVYRAGWR